MRSHRRPRILVVRRRYLGDTVLLEPFLRNLRAHWPDGWLSLVVDTPYVDVLASSPDVDEIIELPVGRWRARGVVGGWTKSAGAVASAPYDLVFDLARNERAQAVMLLARATRRVSFDAEHAPLRRRWIYTDILQVTRQRVAGAHSVDLNNDLLSMLGIPTPFRTPTVAVFDSWRETARALLASLVPGWAPDRTLLLIHPGSGAEARRWPPVNFARVADQAVRRCGASVVVLDGPAERGGAAAVAAAMSEPAALVRRSLTIPDLYGLLAEADLFLCNDSGPMHMAAAVGTPVCALYGAQSRVSWAPLGSANHQTVQPPLPCGEACVAPRTCRPDDPMRARCVLRVPVEAVVEKVVAQLGDGAHAPGRRAERAGAGAGPTG